MQIFIKGCVIVTVRTVYTYISIREEEEEKKKGRERSIVRVRLGAGGRSERHAWMYERRWKKTGRTVVLIDVLAFASRERERERWEIKQMRKWPTKTEAICNTHRERCVRGHTHSLYTSDVWCLPLVQCLSIFSSTCSSYLQISPDGLGLPDRNYYYREPDHAVIIHFTTFASRLFSCVRGISKSVPRGQHPLHTTLSRLYNCRYIISTCDSALHFLYSLTFRSVLVILTAFDFDIDIYRRRAQVVSPTFGFYWLFLMKTSLEEAGSFSFLSSFLSGPQTLLLRNVKTNASTFNPGNL